MFLSYQKLMNKLATSQKNIFLYNTYKSFINIEKT